MIRRIALLALGLALAGITAVLVLWAVPLVRKAFATYRHVQEAAVREPLARADWSREFGDPERLLAAFPKSEDSDAAVRLVALALPLGIDLASHGGDRAVPPEPEAKRVLHRAVADYDGAELQKVGGPVESPPEAVRAHLEASAPALAPLIGFLTSAEGLAWKTDVALRSQAPMPNFSGQIQLQRLLVAEALRRASRGEARDAQRCLAASWALNESLRDRSEVISQLIAISAARLQVGLARRIPVDATWGLRFVEHDYRKSLLRAMEVQTVTGVGALPEGNSVWNRASRADYFDIQREFLVRLREAPVSDDPIDASTRPRATVDPGSIGEVLATIALPNLAASIRRADRLLVDTELTGRILQARDIRERVRRWPRELPGVDASRLAGARWVYAVDADGRLSISLSRELHWKDGKGLVLPTRFESR